MRICVAQTNPAKGNIQHNILQHQKLINLALTHRSEIIIFPELSLTGYEPEMAEVLAIRKEDPRLAVFQQLSNANNITIGVGAPIREQRGITIGLVLFQPGKSRVVYSKAYLHEDELPYFMPGDNSQHILPGIALAICYEISVPEHTEIAIDNGAQTYIASVAKFAEGIETSLDRLSAIAEQHSMTVLMSNCIGMADGVQCAGKSSMWNDQGVLIGQLDDVRQGVLVVDTDKEIVVGKEYANM